MITKDDFGFPLKISRTKLYINTYAKIFFSTEGFIWRFALYIQNKIKWYLNSPPKWSKNQSKIPPVQFCWNYLLSSPSNLLTETLISIFFVSVYGIFLEIIHYIVYNVSPPIFRNLCSQNYRIMPPLGKFIGFWHGSGSLMTTRWCFLFENRFGFLFSAFISFITLSPISKYLKSVIFNLA